MAKRKESTNIDYSIYDSNIEEVDMKNYIEDVSVLYGFNVSVFRACSTIIDGLLPAKRRMLYKFYKLEAFPDKPYKKANELLGPVGELHPHGEISINNVFKNEIKDWETNAPLFDVSGNNGSLTGDGAAAVRYLDVRLSKFAMKCFFEEFDEDITDMVLSNTRNSKEPVYIPTKYPYYLLSLTTGIAWGNACSIPPFNLTEVFRLTQALIKNPDMTKVYLYPDSPRGYDIIESDDIQSICDGGRGTLKIQARLHHDVVEIDGKDVSIIEITGFPEQVYLDPIRKKIASLILDGSITDIESVEDKTDLGDVRLRLILKKTANPKFTIDTLYRKTNLRYHVEINMNFAARTTMTPMGLKDSLLVWIDNRLDYKHRYLLKQLSKLSERKYVLDGIIQTLSPENLDTVIDIIRNSESDDESIKSLCEKFDITSYQARVINDTKLSRLNKASRQKFINERATLLQKVDSIRAIATSRDKIKELVIAELEEGIELFGKPRACNIISKDALKSPLHYFNIVVTKRFIKKISVNTTNVGTLESDDEVVGFFTNISEEQQIYIIDTLGKCYSANVGKLKINDTSSKGTNLKALVGLKGEPIRAITVNSDTDISNMFLYMFTEQGIIKRSPLSVYQTNRMELQGILLNKNDKVCYAMVAETTDKPLMPLIYTSKGFGIMLDLNEILITERLTKGSSYLKLEDNDSVKAICMGNEADIFILTSKGYGKICGLADIMKTTKRRADMIRLISLNEDDSVFRILPANKTDKIRYNCLLQSGERIIINSSDIPSTTRLAKGSKLVPVKRGDAIIKIK